MLKKLTDRILYLPPDSSTDRPILAAILGNDAVLMIDAGNSPAHADLFLESLKASTQRNPDWVVLTHWHWDHTFGLSHLSIPAIGHKNIAQNLSCLKGLSWDDEALFQRVHDGEEIVFCADAIRKEYGDTRNIQVSLPSVYFERLLILDLGGITCELHWIPTDHSNDVLAIYVKEERTLFLSDAFAPNMYAPTPCYTAAMFQKLMEKIEQFSVEWYVESHSLPVRVEEFWEQNRLLKIVSGLILEGITQRVTLLHAVEQRLDAHLPDDYIDVIDQFLASV